MHWNNRFKEKAWKTTKELDRHHTTRFEKHRHDPESSSLSAEKAGVDVWPNVSLTRDELNKVVQGHSKLHVLTSYPCLNMCLSCRPAVSHSMLLEMASFEIDRIRVPIRLPL